MQAATDPASGGWSTLLRTNSPTVPFSFTDPDAATLPMRFYRVVTGSPLP